jgi:hypothetical protein
MVESSSFRVLVEDLRDGRYAHPSALSGVTLRFRVWCWGPRGEFKVQSPGGAGFEIVLRF